MKTAIKLKNNIKIFKLLASSIYKNEINIIESKDEAFSYYKNNLILPSKISISEKKNINKKIYIYNIFFLMTSKKLNLYLKTEKKNIDYIILSSLISVKKINKILFKEFKKLKISIKELYPIINKKRQPLNDMKNRVLLLEIIIKKLTYEKIKNINLNINEKIWLFKVENTLDVTEKNITIKTDSLYTDLCSMHRNYNTPQIYALWGYINKINKIKTEKILKNIINKNRKTFKKMLTDKKKINQNKTLSNKKKINLYPLFDYKKTHDKHTHGNKTKEHSQKPSENSETSSTISDNSYTPLILKSDMISEIKQLENKNKKITQLIKYDEWNYKNKEYKKNWCHIFINKIKIKDTNIKKNNLIKNQIKKLKQKINLILNKKQFINKQKIGDNIDIDSIVDNYKDVVQNNFNNIYIKKHKIIKNTSLIILIDSSMSTESYIKNNTTLDEIKNIANILAHSITHSIKNFLIAAFYSNTRYDCRYLILKDFNDKWPEKEFSLKKIQPTGYTRIGPAIRHSINLLKKIKAENKLIILISDGNPTDYDEYEGIYGIYDIKKSIKEAKKTQINIKCILIDNYKNKLFKKILGKGNYITIKTSQIYTNLIIFFNLLVKNN